MSGLNPDSRSRFPRRIEVRCPATLPDVIERTAQRRLMTPSEYIRQSLFERLKADGVSFDQFDAVA